MALARVTDSPDFDKGPYSVSHFHNDGSPASYRSHQEQRALALRQELMKNHSNHVHSLRSLVSSENDHLDRWSDELTKAKNDYEDAAAKAGISEWPEDPIVPAPPGVKKYLCCPGWVQSDDDDWHYITCTRLTDLYNVNPRECVFEDAGTQGMEEDWLDQLIELHPDPDGDYTLPSAEPLRGEDFDW